MNLLSTYYLNALIIITVCNFLFRSWKKGHQNLDDIIMDRGLKKVENHWSSYNTLGVPYTDAYEYVLAVNGVGIK